MHDRIGRASDHTTVVDERVNREHVVRPFGARRVAAPVRIHAGREGASKAFRTKLGDILGHGSLRLGQDDTACPGSGGAPVPADQSENLDIHAYGPNFTLARRRPPAAIPALFVLCLGRAGESGYFFWYHRSSWHRLAPISASP